jgi:hypothetical protein
MSTDNTQDKRPTLDDLDLTAMQDEAATMDVLSPIDRSQLYAADGKTPMQIGLLGLESSTAEAIKKKARDRQRKRLGRPMTDAETTAYLIELYTALTKWWRGVEWKGEPLECTPANIAMLYRVRPWLRGQVGEFMGENANFLTPAASSSSNTPSGTGESTTE